MKSDITRDRLNTRPGTIGRALLRDFRPIFGSAGHLVTSSPEFGLILSLLVACQVRRSHVPRLNGSSCASATYFVSFKKLWKFVLEILFFFSSSLFLSLLFCILFVDVVVYLLFFFFFLQRKRYSFLSISRSLLLFTISGVWLYWIIVLLLLLLSITKVIYSLQF